MLILFWILQTWPVTLSIQEQMFSGCTVLPDSKDTILGSSNQEASPPAGKKTGVVLVPCLRMEVCPYIYFQWCGIFLKSHGVTTDKFLVGVTKITSKICVS